MLLNFQKILGIKAYARWLFDHKIEEDGMDLEVATEHVDWSYLASTFTQVTGIYLDLSLTNTSPSTTLIVRSGTSVDKRDNTWRQNFGGFWKHGGGNKGNVTRDYAMLDRILSGRVRTVAEWMRRVGYDGKPRRLLKDWADGGMAVKGVTAAIKL